MNTHSLVSVIVPVYNQAHLLVYTLDSIVRNSYSNFELIIIDDCSIDNSIIVIEDWLKKQSNLRVTFVNNLINLGVTKTLNCGIMIAEGEFITIIAADDILLEDGILDRINYLKDNPKKLAVFGNCDIIDINGQVTTKNAIENLIRNRSMNKALLNTSQSLYYEIIFRWSVPGPVFMCKKEFYRQIGLYDESLEVEDLDMYIRAAKSKTLGFLDKNVSQYRIHGTSMTQGTMVPITIDAIVKTYLKHRKSGFVTYLRFTARIYHVYRIKSQKITPKIIYFVLSKVTLVIPEMFYNIRKYTILLIKGGLND